MLVKHNFLKPGNNCLSCNLLVRDSIHYFNHTFTHSHTHMLDHTHTHSLNHSLTYYVTHSHTQLILWPSTHGLILLPGMQVPGLSASFWQCCWSRWRQVLSGPPMADIMLGQTSTSENVVANGHTRLWVTTMTVMTQWLWVTTMTVSTTMEFVEDTDYCTEVSAHQIFYNLSLRFGHMKTQQYYWRVPWVSWIWRF